MAKRGLSFEKTVAILSRVAAALDYAHANDVIHRDIKPSNIFLARTPKGIDVSIIDFGLADEVKTSLSRVTQKKIEISGTRPYLSPEQWRGHSHSPATDQYALAVVAYEMLAGHVPFKIADTELLRLAVIHEMPKPIPDVPEHVNAALQKALAKRGTDRFAHCTEFIKNLQSAFPSTVVPPTPPKDVAAEKTPKTGGKDDNYYSDYSDIFDAARNGSVEDVWYFLEGQKTYYTEKETRVNRKDPDGCTPLHHAAAGNPDVNVLKYLVSCGAHVNAVDNAGWTPLHYAADENPVFEVLEYLISAGADVHARTNSTHWGIAGGKTPLDFADTEYKKAYLIAAEELAHSAVRKAEPVTPRAETVRSKVYLEMDKRLIAVALLLPLLLGVMFAYYQWNPTGVPKNRVNPAQAKNQPGAIAPVPPAPDPRRNDEINREAPQPNRRAGDRTVLKIKNVEYAFRWCPPGTFMMGSPENEEIQFVNERQQHEVTLSRGFWMLETEVTEAMWESVMGSNPSYFKGAKLPVERVSWDDCQEFIKKLNDLKVAPAGYKFSLPTEAQWEYACRAGTTTAYHFGDTLTQQQANFKQKQWRDFNVNLTKEVGSYPANAWGLKDMHGNVWEWCQDWFGAYPSGAVTDPTGAERGSYRVRRGGGWGDDARDCRSAIRGDNDPANRIFSIGLRLSLVFE